ncbi:right-handed parallel beta-helix repeat-containing protein, partial [archaeon]|nr:right-handed parallel beta-helix repeat-containing protein [archaeon]
MVYKKYIYKKGKKFGPYYFKSVRSNDGSVKSIYLGKRHPNYKLGIVTLLFIGLFLISFLGYFTYNAYVVSDDVIDVESGLDIEDGLDEKIVEDLVDVFEKEEVGDFIEEEIVENETLDIIELNETEEIIKPNTSEINLTEIDNETIIYNQTINLTEINESDISVNETEVVNDSIIQINETEEIIKPNASEINLTEIDNETIIYNQTINITEVNESVVLVNETIIDRYFGVKVNEPVQWEKHVTLEKAVKSLTVKLPKGAENITFEKLDTLEVEFVKLDDTKQAEVGAMEGITGGVVKDLGYPFSKIINFFKDIFRFTGFVVFEEKELVIEGPVQEVLVQYSLSGPVSEEIEVDSLIKQVVVSSEVDYKDVLVYTNLENISGGIRIVDSKGNRVPFTFLDNDGDGKREYVEWISLTSNEIFNISITVLNVQSYPVVGGNWTVSFDTVGVADLKITAINGTTWGESTSEDDLALLEIKCGDDLLNYSWLNDSVFIPDYSCNETGNESSYVRTSGKHYLEFDFGGEKAYAKNAASCGDGLSSDTVLEGDIIDCNTHGLQVWAHGITIDCAGFTIDGDKTDGKHGINIGGYDGVTVKNCYIKEFDNGILTWGASANNYIFNNTFYNNTDYHILLYTGSHNTSVINNALSVGGTTGAGGTAIYLYGNDQTVSGNNISSVSTGVDLRGGSGSNVSNNVMSTLINYGVYFSTGTHNSLCYNNSISEAGYGVRVNGVENNTVDSNALFGNIRNLYVQSSSDGTKIVNNHVSNGTGGYHGIYLTTPGLRTEVRNNTVYGNEGSGIYITGMDYGLVIGNNLTNNNLDGTYGGQLEMLHSEFNEVTNNVVFGGGFFAARLYNEFYNNTFRNNTFSNSSDSLIYFENLAHDNKFYDNSFEENLTSGSGFYISKGDRNLIVNANFVGDKNPVHGSGANYTTYINCSLDNMFNGGTGGQNYTVRWFVELNVTDSSGNALENANISIYDDSDVLVFTELTNFTGYITLKNLTEYVFDKGGGSVYVYEDNYTINTTSPSDSYLNDTTLLNLSITNSAILNIILNINDVTVPTITWEDSTPNNGDSVSESFIYLNSTVTDESNTSAFYDWNNDLLGYWSFEEVLTNGTVYDNSSYGNDGVMNNFGSNTTVFGKYGNALEFDGSNDYFDLPFGSEINPFTTPHTFEFWAKPKETSENQMLFSSGTGTNERMYIGMTGGDWEMGIQSSSWGAGTTNVITDWTYITLVMNGSSALLYINGNFDHTKPYTSYSLDQNIDVGRNAESIYWFNGTIDEVRVHSRALSLDEINASYNNGLYRLYNNFTDLNKGLYNYSTYAIDAAGNLNKTGLRNVTVSSPPTITWDPPTPNNGGSVSETSVYLNSTVTDESNTSAFFDWNNSLLGYWSFDDYNTTGIFDNSSYGNMGSFEGGAAASDSISAKFGRGLTLDTTDYIDTHMDYSLSGSGEPFSVFMWVKDIASCTNAYVMVQSDIASYSSDWILGYIDGGLWVDGVSVGGGNTICDGAWHQIGFTSEPGNPTYTSKLYIDGNYIGSAAGPGIAEPGLGSVKIMGRGDGAAGAAGKVDEVKIWKRLLSNEEINASYNNRLYKLYYNFTGLVDGQTYNYSAYAIDTGGNLNVTGLRTVTLDSTKPTIIWEDPTPTDGDTIYVDNVYLNATVTDESDTSAFFDWNNSLLGYWSFEEVLTNGIVYDNSSYGNDGIMNNFGSNNTVSGHYGQAVEAVGGTEWINTVNTIDGMGALTLEAWIKTDFQSYDVLIKKTDCYAFAQTVSGEFRFDVENSTGDVVTVAGGSISDGEWHHIVGVYDGSITKAYVDGIEVDSSPASGNIQDTASRLSLFGAQYAGGGANATMDEIKVYSRALSPEEINASYNNGLYRLYNNFIGLTSGTYNYSAYAIDTGGNLNVTGLRTVTLDSTKPTI